MRRILLLSTFLVGLVTGSAGAQAPDSAKEAVLRPGDAIRIAVWRQPDMTGEFPIAEDGTITHPLFREVRVTGVPLAEVQRRMRAFLGRFESTPQFVIEPLFRVSVGGEVRTPNLYALPPETTVAQAVALAGGSTERGRMDRVRLFRGGGVTVVDLTAPDGGLADSFIRSGDQIFVDRKVSVFREYIAPASSIVAALAAIATVIIRANN